MLNMEIYGIESLQIDFEKEEKEIENKIPYAMRYMGSEMVYLLQRHIREDWYNPYMPVEYPRRTDNPSLGTPLGDSKNMEYEVFGSRKGRKLFFTYYPTGEHEEDKWHERDGDDLIESIQKGYPILGKYDTPPRAFWNNFVRELKAYWLMEKLVEGMQPYSIIYTLHEVDFDGDEGLLMEKGGIAIF